MIRGSGNPLVAAGMRRLMPAAFVVVTSGAIAAPHANANTNTKAPAIREGVGMTLVAGDGQGDSNYIKVRAGNGKLNRTYATVLSPTVNRGIQQVSNTNISGTTNDQVAFCHKKHRFCKIRQRIWAPHP